MSVREGYKQTEIGLIPEEWSYHTFEEAKIQIIDGDRGTNYPKQHDFFQEGFCLFLSAKNVTKRGFEFFEKQFITQEKDLLLRKGKLSKFDIVLTTRGTVGNIAYNDISIPFENMRINSGMVLIRVQENLDSKYLYKIMTSELIQKNIQNIAFGSAQPQLTVKEIKNFKIPIPPLPEQQKIAEILSTVDQKIDSIDTKIKETQTLKRGLMQRLLSEGIGHNEFKESEIGRIPTGWEVDKLENHVTIVSGQSPSSFDLYGEQYKFFKVNQLNFCTKYLYESEYAFDISNYNNLHSGTVIFPKRGASIFTNKVRILATEGYIDTNLMGLITKKTLNNEYLYYWLISFELSA